MYDFPTDVQSESALSDSPHQPSKERDRDGGWEDGGHFGGRVKKPKSRKKIPEEWAIHAEPFVPASACMPQEFATDFSQSPLEVDSGLMSLSENFNDESLISMSLTQDLLSLTATSPPSSTILNLQCLLQSLPVEPPIYSPSTPFPLSSGFKDILMETEILLLATSAILSLSSLLVRPLRKQSLDKITPTPPKIHHQRNPWHLPLTALVLDQQWKH